jgi:hypothetical protein
MNVLFHHGLFSAGFMLANINLYEGDRDFYKELSRIQTTFLTLAGAAMGSDELIMGPFSPMTPPRSRRAT